MTSRYAEPLARAARRPGAGAAADRSADRPVRNGLVHQAFRAREEMLQIAIEEWMASEPDLHQADAEGAEVRGRRRRHDLQGPAARHRRAAAVHGLPLHRARPLARRVPPRPLRRADGRRADGRGLRPRHVPRHRGPDVRRHRGRHQPQGADPARSTGRRGYPPTGTRTARGR